MKALKLGVHRVLRRLGLDVVRYPSSPASPDARSVEARRNWWLANCGITLLLDVGANVGQYARSVRARGYSGRIVSFEPLSTAFSELQRNAEGDPAWEVFNIALGAEPATAMLNVSGYSESSSILPMCDRHVAAFPPSAYIGHEAVSVVPLDSLASHLVRSGDAVWLKLDVQGYEMQVLGGAERTLRDTRLIEMELSLVRLYEGQALICESIERLRGMGFQLIAVEDAFVDDNSRHTLQVNGIFERMPA
jgi:FkbM family methyltransferase